jgi:hypothetical protein
MEVYRKWRIGLFVTWIASSIGTLATVLILLILHVT